MDPRFRKIFNAQYSDALYTRYQRDLSGRLNAQFEFRLAESPVFLPDDFAKRVTAAAREVIEQLSDPARLEKMRRAIPPRWDTPGMDALPSFAQVDFAVTRDSGGALAPKLIELQGFPSLTALQVMQRDAWNDALHSLEGLDHEWSCWFSGYDRNRFLDLARRTIAAGHDPAEVVLLDIDPPRQKTATDFAATKLLFDVDAVDP
ncbi:MAG TPA: hypothetical protein VM779_04795, partial [Thermoanaerobaculia bacterium]|nr:hypothetical protein [Thermoanaerobaculia bacterium]